MNVIRTEFKGLLILEPQVFGDDRGYFMEAYNEKTFRDAGIDIKFVQDNQSLSSKGVLRGLHFQRPPYAQTKLVRVLKGTILDVVVDLRKEEPTFKKTLMLEISAENKKQLLVPKGFAHGFVVLSNSAEVLYKCDELYNAKSEGGIFYADPELNIDWRIRRDEIILSEKDACLPLLTEPSLQFF